MLPQFAWAQAVLANRRPFLSVGFKHGVHSTQMPDGSWNLWVRVGPKNGNVSTVRLLLQVAEDENFDAIIAEQIHIARKEISYIVRTNFSTKLSLPELYFRFVALDSGLPENLKAVQVSPIGVLVNSAMN
ncbi:PhoD-like phosphatase N-terminal domain-containing protein [Massilia sp. YIM B02769]|uniref:PhoD-like phosphatase N-terminal domain-containing protein n=1 Tax=Massilia sp. YIM B02769 TaxID=3050129 RepID=UPI0025B6DC74|nr:PhoD-like phosphatase N-terminal domain-containing protein [Massilia sp. YIM B02769]MDN4061679.1 PhoD-like phosphatase N-terminal domain-containing protein [Massilia sp. YIM B02769]